RHPEIGSQTDGRAEELFRRHADNRVSGVVNRDGFADRGRITVEPFLPPRITDDCNGMCAFILIVGVVQDTTESGIDSQYGKVTAGDKLHLQRLDVTVISICIDETMHIPRNAQQASDTRKQIGALLHSSIEWI